MNSSTTLPAPTDSRQFGIIFPGTTEEEMRIAYTSARTLADFYSQGLISEEEPKKPIVVKYDKSLHSYYWKPHKAHPHWEPAWQKIFDHYDPVPLQIEEDDKPPGLMSAEEMKKAENLTMRQRIKQQVGVAARTRKLEFDEVWIIAYGYYLKETGIHPAVESARRNLKVHLDVVFEDAKGPAILMECINKIILKGVKEDA